MVQCGISCVGHLRVLEGLTREDYATMGIRFTGPNGTSRKSAGRLTADGLPR